MPRIGWDKPSRDNFHWIGEDWIFNYAYVGGSRDETQALGKKRFPKDPAMIVVCPTKALEEDMVCTANVGRESLCTFRAGKVLNGVEAYVNGCS